MIDTLIVWFGLAIITALAANSRGREPVGWFFIACLFPVFALLAVLVMGKADA